MTARLFCVPHSIGEPKAGEIDSNKRNSRLVLPLQLAIGFTQLRILPCPSPSALFGMVPLPEWASDISLRSLLFDVGYGGVCVIFLRILAILLCALMGTQEVGKPDHARPRNRSCSLKNKAHVHLHTHAHMREKGSENNNRPLPDCREATEPHRVACTRTRLAAKLVSA